MKDSTWNIRRSIRLAFFAVLLTAAPTFAQFEPLPSFHEVFAKNQGPFGWAEKLGELPLTWHSPHRWITIDYSGTFEVEGYVPDTRAPGLIMTDHPFFNYRDKNWGKMWVGDHLFFFAEERDNRGFNPGDRSLRSDFEQYFVRYMPFEEAWLNIQVGKFPTPVGNFVPRHETFSNPFIRDPLPYDFMTVVGEAAPVPNVTTLLARRDIPDMKEKWLPMIWGPVYHTGVETFGTIGKFEYAFAVTDAALSSRPDQWDLDSDTDEKFNYSGRIGYSPVIGLKLGTSYAIGPYLARNAATDPFKNYKQETWGVDAAYSIGHWEFWSEFFATSWEVPNISDKLEACSYYVETRYKFTPGFYGSLRWGQIFFGEVTNAAGTRERWDRDAWRIEAGLGYFFARNLVGKIQYEHNHQNSTLQQGENMISLQLALKL